MTPNEQLAKFLDILLQSIQEKHDVDFVQAILNCFLKVHYDLINEESQSVEDDD